MKCGSQIAVAVVGGYVLGRSRKTRLAALLALMAAGGGKLPVGPEDLLRKSPLAEPLEKLTGDLRSQLVDAGMSVAKRAASNRIDSLSDRLQERAETLRGTGRRAEEAREEAGEEEAGEERARPRRERREPARRRREEPRRSRAREPEYDEGDYDEDGYARDEYEDDRGGYDDYGRDEYDEDRGGYERDERERSRRGRRPPLRSARPEPRRIPRRDDDLPRRGRSPR
jgi:hypothetical protein